MGIGKRKLVLLLLESEVNEKFKKGQLEAKSGEKLSRYLM